MNDEGSNFIRLCASVAPFLIAPAMILNQIEFISETAGEI